ncbi:SAC3/GANP/Nin1/mts3/eIF-3 p25 family-domain-containing protein [Chytriomyces sp. MP71]|nr:SAC3/GANP/Nin1/mts3/eIF-3 p25 family-domain-containing protein [Chytriomyces sp. MP71]
MVGECEDMCPEFERHEREFQNTLHPYEKLDGVDGVDHKRAVKRYRRSASDGFAVLPCDIRPPRVLIKTLDYLFHEIIPTKGLEDSHDFVRDRTRGIRNDFTLQNYREYEAVECHERIARYHIICASKLMDTENFSLQQEQEQMRKTLQSLREYYIDMNKRGIPCPNEAEFQAYYILSHFWQNEIVTMAETLPAHVYDDARVQRAIELQQLAQCATAPVFKGMRRALGGLAFSSRLFRVLGDVGTPYLVAALVHQEFVRIRCNVLRTMNRALYDFAPHVDVGELVGLLGCDDEEEVLNILDYYEIKVEEGMDGRLVAFVGKDVDGNKVKAKFFNGTLLMFWWFKC